MLPQLWLECNTQTTRALLEKHKRWNRIEKRTLPPTLTEAAKRWREERASLASGTCETYEAALEHLRKALGNTLVCEIEARDIASYQRDRLAEVPLVQQSTRKLLA